MRERFWTRTFLILAALGVGLCLSANPSQDRDSQRLDEELNREFKGRTLFLKYPFDQGKVNLKRDWQPPGKDNPPAWTLYSGFLIYDIRARETAYTIKAERVVVHFRDGKPRYFRIDAKLEIWLEKESAEPHSREDFVRTLGKVAVSTLKELAVFLPDYWRSTLVPEPAAPADERKRRSARQGEGLKAPSELTPPSARSRKGFKAIPARRIHSVSPKYPKLARSARLGGTVLLEGEIGVQGTVTILRILKPAGAGLDEAAIKAVRQWRYEPLRLDGAPTPVLTQIEVVFSP